MTAKYYFRSFLVAVLSLISFTQARAGYTSESVTISVGETVTLTVPSVIQQYSINTLFTVDYTDCVRRVSASRHSITVKGVKATTTEVRITCNYQLSTLETGEHVFRVTVRASGSTGGSTGIKDHITLPATLKLNVGESKSVTAYTDAGMSVMWDWYGSDDEFVTYKLGGRYYETATFTGVAEGNTFIYAKSNLGGSARMDIIVVKPVPAESFALEPEELTLEAGSVYTLNYKVVPENATDADITSWTSSDKSVAVVDANGTVKALAVGTAVITACTEAGLQSQCNVTVTPAVPELVIDDNSGLADIPAKAHVSYTRQLYKGWNSFCLPFTVTADDLPDGCRLAVYSGSTVVDGAQGIAFSTVHQADAGVPFLVHAPQDMTFTYSGTDVPLVSAPLDGGTAKGTFVRTVIGAGCYKLNADGTAFGKTRGQNAISAPFRLYIPCSDK